MKAIARGFGKSKIIGVNLEEKAETLKQISDMFGIEFVNFTAECGGETLGYLCGINGFEKSGIAKNTDKQLLIFSGVEKNSLNKILSGLRAQNIQIPLKAIATATNISWTVSDLACELEKEHKLMNGGENND